MRYRTENQMKLVLIRHGATDSNLQRRYIGKTDEDLSPKGIQDIKNHIKNGRYPDASFAAVSPMIRCIRTAELIYGKHRPFILIDELKEMDFGQFEGKNHEELKDTIAYQVWLDSGGMSAFPQGESRADFVRRCTKGFERFCSLAADRKETDSPAVIVAHGGTLMAILSSYGTGSYYAYQCENGGGYSCELVLEKTIKIEQIEEL